MQPTIKMKKVLSCSWMGEYTSETLLPLKGGVQNSEIKWKIVSPFSWQRGENVNEIDSGCQTESLDNISKAASGHFHQRVSINKIRQWAIDNKVNPEKFSNNLP